MLYVVGKEIVTLPRDVYANKVAVLRWSQLTLNDNKFVAVYCEYLSDNLASSFQSYKICVEI